MQMIVLFYRDAKRKAIFSLLVVALWAFMYYISGLFFEKVLVLNITIGDMFSFSCSPALKLGNMYVHHLADDAITVNSNNVGPESQKFSTYNSLKGKFSFEYPSIFTLSEKEFPSSEILYHIDFNDNERIVHGFVQVWDLPYSLKDFLDKSKANSTLNYKSFKSTEAAIDDKEGYLWDYTVLGGNENIKYKALEYFFKKGSRMYRISMFAPESHWSENKVNIFWGMVKSFKVFRKEASDTEILSVITMLSYRAPGALGFSGSAYCSAMVYQLVAKLCPLLFGYYFH